MEEVKAFNRAALEYDKWFEEHAKWFSSELAALKLAVPKTGKGIEIGVGTGRFAGELRIETGVDPSEKMAEVASKRGIRVFKGYAEDLPIPDGSFDYSLMVTVDCFLQDVAKAFKEAWRITKPGGSIIIGMIDKSSPLGRKYHEHKKDNPFYRSANFHDVEEIKNLLEEAGFQDFNFWQTLVNAKEEILEEPIKGYGKGGFVVIKALKKVDKK
ncbi:class I SAM-dependent methyltransferase [Salegentibacter flavus]|uniref:Ubiquinone/menaquinone biosynthesis C-methylase UbiE n=1 Tax=Salegentibacter flavus TaxID=287099 RepID=A0A1I5CJG8_9FLAO|nr:class I SAM-dependent methyltransferase [Salegentibacter flavus]SFN87012.1 Ubiquinone/menaquinone biosynthesis C-methylase UbiE [Salegentibacter flavus]